MPLRKLLLRVMLFSLAAAAVLGVIAILFFREVIIARVIGTAMSTAIAAGLLMSLSLLADRENCRAAGVLGMAAVVAEYLLGLGLTWLFDSFGNSQWNEAVGVLMLTIAGMTLPAMFYLRIQYVPQGRIAAGVGIGVCAIVSIIFAATPWFNRSWTDYGRWSAIGMCIGIFGVLASASLAGVGFDRRHWRYVGVLAALAGAAMGILGIWEDMHDGSLAFAIIASLAAVVAHANLALLCPLKAAQQWLAYATIVCTVLTAAGIDVVIALNDPGIFEIIGRVSGAAGILAGCGSLALLILAAFNRKTKPKAVLSQISQYTLICPGCSKKQTLPVGDARCPTCLLEIHVSFTEPRCPKCEYLLYMLQSDRCPECGTLVRGPAANENAEPAPPAVAGVPPAVST